MEDAEMQKTPATIKTAVIGVQSSGNNGNQQKKPPFRPAQDDTKPSLHDPILRSDPMEAEEAVLRLPPFPSNPKR